MKLKVYGWTGRRVEIQDHNRNSREICAAPSKVAVARAAGVRAHGQLWCLGETGNKDEIAQAMQAPGRVFWRGIDDRGGVWTMAAEPKQDATA